MISEMDYNRIKNFIQKGKFDMTLESILAKVGNCKEIKLMDGAHDSLKIIGKEVFYVQPQYEEIKKDLNAKFIIFSAPGASGKSALAKYITYKKNGLYWDLAKIKLGENSFHGTLWRAFGQEGFTDFMNNINAGKALLILDAFDEAEMISGRSGVEFLLKDLDEVTKGNIIPTIYLFARTESANFISEYFDEHDVKYSRYEIGFFEEYNAIEFIRKKVSNDGTAITQVVNECINEQFNTIKKLLGEEGQARSFIGYAPVLEALAKAFDEERNTVRLLESIRGDNITGTNIIFEILDSLLEREHNKVREGLIEKWRVKYPEFVSWDSIYSKEEQMVRIIEYILFENIEENSLYENKLIPAELYIEYIDVLKRFLPQHPFLQNTLKDGGIEFTGPAFRDYTLSYLLAFPIYEDFVFEYFSDRTQASHFPSQLLFDFYVEFKNESIPGKFFPLLYDSYKAKETATKSAFINASGSGNDKYIVFGLQNYSDEKDVQETELQIKAEGAFYISRIANASIDLDGDIYIGDSKSVTRIYNSSLIGQRLVFNTSDIFLEARKPGYCLLGSKEDVVNKFADIPKFDIKFDNPDMIKIDIPNINNYFRLRPYIYELESDSDDEFLKFTLFVGKLMNCLRKHRKDAPAKDREFIDNEIISQNLLKRKIMDFLLEVGIIYIDEQVYLYKLNVDELSNYGLNWVVMSKNEQDCYKELYRKYIKRKEQ